MKITDDQITILKKYGIDVSKEIDNDDFWGIIEILDNAELNSLDEYGEATKETYDLETIRDTLYADNEADYQEE